jgi:hypothetical protein
MKKYGCVILCISLLSTLFAGAAEVQNVRFEDRGARIAVMYDLQGDSGKQYKISISLRDASGKTYKLSKSAMSGDIGKGVQSGFAKTILWDMLKDYPEGLEGEGFVFAVQVELQKKKKIWPYIAVGGAVIGGVMLLGGGGEEKGNLDIEITDQF